MPGALAAVSDSLALPSTALRMTWGAAAAPRVLRSAAMKALVCSSKAKRSPA